jgi:hypothetical protein
MRVNNSEKYLKQLRSGKSQDPPSKTIEQKIKSQAPFFEKIHLMDLQESISSDITSEKE